MEVEIMVMLAAGIGRVVISREVNGKEDGVRAA